MQIPQEPLFAVPAGVLQQVADYLQSRPYREVVALLQMIGQAKPLTTEPEIRNEQ